MEFSKQEYWSGLTFPSPGDLPNLGIKPGSSMLQADSLVSEVLAHGIYTEYIMRNAGLDEAQVGINISGRNINNLRYADDTTLRQKAKNN